MTMYVTEDILYQQYYHTKAIRTVNNFGYNILTSGVSYRNLLLSAERRIISCNGGERRCRFQR